MKRLEQEVLSRLDDFGETRRALALDEVMVTPAQFLGIEVKPWAAAIAELVLWIGHLQWWIRLHPGYTPPEPILQRYENIQCRDAVLTWAGTRETGRSRWDGRTFKKHHVTGRDVPDEGAQVAILECIEPQQAEWPEADFIVGNPPFLGNKRMREALGDGYSEALRAAYPDVPESVDFVLYWWHRAAAAVRGGRTKRFGLITTNSITQTFNRKVIAHHTSGKCQLELLWAIPDHPWTDEGAAVRIAMTVGGMEGLPWLGHVVEENLADTPETTAETVRIEGRTVDVIHEDLSSGANVSTVRALASNYGLASNGFALHGRGFIVNNAQWESWGSPRIVHPLLNGKGFSDRPYGIMVIDFFGLTEQQARDSFPGPYQHVLENVKPERQQNNRATYRERWWVFGEARAKFRPALKGLGRYIATAYTSKYRVFQIIDASISPDDMLVVIASSDAFHLGVLSSNVHRSWASQAGTRLGVGNDLRYNNSRCFDPFPFPNVAEAQKAVIRDLAERLDAHRKAAQGRGVTITGMYNLLQKLRSGEPFTTQDRQQHDLAQTEILRQLHDELDVAVLDAYGWPHDIEDAEILERLVALNRERAAEEAQGVIRWLRPEYQCPQSIQPVAKPILELEPEPTEKVVSPQVGIVAQPWPKDLKDQLAAVRNLLISSDRLWSLEEVGSAFKSRCRYRESIQAHLGLLSDLGVIAVLETVDGVRFHRPQAVVA